MAPHSDNPDDMNLLDQSATPRDILELRTELIAELRQQFAALHTHFDVVAESVKRECRELLDSAQATTSSLGTRVDGLEREHGAALTSLSTRVRSLETKRRR